MSDNYLTIVPAKGENGKPTGKTQGTQVLMPDGTPIPRVLGVEISGDAFDVWRVKVKVDGLPQEIKAKLVELIDIQDES